MATDKVKQFQVVPGQAVNLHATGLYDGDAIVIQYAIDKGCKPSLDTFTDYYENGKLVVLDIPHNPLTLWRPGWYRMVLDGTEANNLRVVLSNPFNIDIVGLINNVATP